MNCRIEYANISVRDMREAVRFDRDRLQWEFIQYLSEDPEKKNHYD
jgi:hypothetical protein